MACSPQSLTSSSGFYTHNAYDSCNGHSPPGAASRHFSPDSATSGFSGSLFSGSAMSGISNQRERGGLLSPSCEYLHLCPEGKMAEERLNLLKWRKILSSCPGACSWHLLLVTIPLSQQEQLNDPPVCASKALWGHLLWTP